MGTLKVVEVVELTKDVELLLGTLVGYSAECAEDLTEFLLVLTNLFEGHGVSYESGPEDVHSSGPGSV